MSSVGLQVELVSGELQKEIIINQRRNFFNFLFRVPGEGNGNPLQYSCLENPMDGGAWWATVHGGTESNRTERLHSLTHSQPINNVVTVSGEQRRDSALNHTYACIHSPSKPPPIQAATQHGAEFPVLYNRFPKKEFLIRMW